MIQFHLPEDLERELRRSLGDLDQAARDALLIQSYQDGALSVGQLGRALGVGVLGAEAWLAERKVPLGYTAEEFEEDLATFDALLPKPQAT